MIAGFFGMSYEDRIRKGLKVAGLGSAPWVELLALNMLPDPGHDLSGKRPLRTFTCPRWLHVNIITGEKHRMSHWVLKVRFNAAGIADVEGYNAKYWKIPLARIREIEVRYWGTPDRSFLEEPAVSSRRRRSRITR